MNEPDLYMYKLKSILNFEPEDYNNLQKYKDRFIPLVDGIIDQFYVAIENDPELMNFFIYTTNLERAMKWQKAYFIELLQGVVDEQYIQKRIHSGWLHAEIGLPISFFIAFYRFFTINLFEMATSVAQVPIDEQYVKFITSLVKLILLDLSISAEVHEKTMIDHSNK